MSTPLQRLDDAIHQFLTETGELVDGKWVTGWILSASTARVEDGGEHLPLVSGAQYALGPQTSITDAAGLARFITQVVDRAFRDDE